MRRPQTAPSWLESKNIVSPERLNQIYSQAYAIWKEARYYHWDELRRRPPPAELTHDEWWYLLKLKRAGDLKFVPLSDTAGRSFSFILPDLLIEQLHRIDCGLGSPLGVPEAVLRPESRDYYLVSTLIQESITSSQLEGAVTTREVAKEMLRSGRPPRDRSERMILNNYLTMQRIVELRDSPLTPDLVFEVHRLVTNGTLERTDAAGRFRLEKENVRVEDETGEVFHRPPPARELPARCVAMCDFANGRSPDYFIHPVIRAIILHFWLAYDHPFVDGNGRAARALFYWSMLHGGFRLFEFISISQAILQAPIKYALAFLHTETDENDLTYFILHQADVIKRATAALHEYVEYKTSSLREADKHLRGLGNLNHRQQTLMAHALRQPGTRYTIAAHRHSHNVVYQTAREDLLALMRQGLLLQEKRGKTFVFRVPSDLGDKLSKLADSTPSPATADLTLPLNLPFVTRSD
ncbi:MAG TPA: Fic family protein [Opitutaceae bacterium]|nr:Fic family protein [Opitutaceae bacterium]